MIFSMIPRRSLVSTHAPARGRRDALPLFPGCFGFNSRPREGATQPCGERHRAIHRFNSRPREGATINADRSFSSTWFQLTPPRGGDSQDDVHAVAPPPVSTHAPARGRLALSQYKPRICQVFQLTPPRGGDRFAWLPVGGGLRFQLTPPRGGDEKGTNENHNRMISFNSRPREGATLQSLRTPAVRPSFNSRPREGATVRFEFRRGLRISFNSRPREGATKRTGRPRPHRRRFQLTPPRGGDMEGVISTFTTICFNSRPREGATRRYPHPPRPSRVSTHAPARGRLYRMPCPLSTMLFQLTPPRGGDRGVDMIVMMGSAFQLTPPRGGDFSGGKDSTVLWVSTHAPARGRPGGG